MHKYTVKGHPRVKIIICITIFAGIISSFINEQIQVISNNFNMTITYSISVLTCSTLLYIFFSKVVWKNKFFRYLFKYPNFNGEWIINGRSFNEKLNKEFKWEGKLIITQTWDEILIILRTKSSSSDSRSTLGNIEHIKGHGYKLTYEYNNNPNMCAEKDMRKHEGKCDLIFNENFLEAKGNYFNNNRDRSTNGELILTKE
ncbi:MAG: hypothetical protein WBG30_01765 [Psychrilyobacter sp.]|uniref:Cap15 family cyclic dinucleotide receptor domain-containing protein n=1 Tax=Psychrilyobacter sp. TaxID=2586924 RepID=UPI003C7185F6